MSQSIHFTTTVQPGGKIEIVSESLPVGEMVNVVILPTEPVIKRPTGDVVEFLKSLPPGPRSFKSWEDVEREVQAERNAWDR
jgi:hypothetical protein